MSEKKNEKLKMKLIRRIDTEKSEKLEFRVLNYSVQFPNEQSALELATEWKHTLESGYTLKHMTIKYGKFNLAQMIVHRDIVTPILSQTGRALLHLKDENKNVMFWAKTTLNVLSKYDIEFVDEIDWETEINKLEAETKK